MKMKNIKINWKSVAEEVLCFIPASLMAFIAEEYIWGHSFVGNISVFIVTLLIVKGIYALLFNNKQR